MNNEIIEYVRDAKGRKLGCVMATDRNKIGWSLCHRTDRFSKDMAKRIARGRAEKGIPLFYRKSTTEHTILHSNEAYVSLFYETPLNIHDTFIVSKETFDKNDFNDIDFLINMTRDSEYYKLHYLLKTAKRVQERAEKYFQ